MSKPDEHQIISQVLKGIHRLLLYAKFDQNGVISRTHFGFIKPRELCAGPVRAEHGVSTGVLHGKQQCYSMLQCSEPRIAIMQKNCYQLSASLMHLPLCRLRETCALEDL